MDALAEQMPSRLFGEWVAFYRLEPRGDLRADLRSALQTAFLFNIQVEEKQRRKVEDFLLRFDPAETAEQEAGPDWKRMLAVAEQVNAVFGGEDLRPAAAHPPAPQEQDDWDDEEEA